MLSDFGLVETNAAAVKPLERYGRLVVIETGQIPDTYKYYAICWCDCNSGLKRIRFDGLIAGMVVSCGCYQKERSTTHGMHSSQHYSRWSNMLDRCYNVECTAYPNYGGRGISVCAEWHDIAKYVEQLPEGYFDGAHLDRIDNDGDYEPSNVRWVTPAQNHDNRRSGHLITFNGKTQSVTAWSKETGLSANVISGRILDSHWSVEKTLTTPVIGPDERMAIARQARWGNHTKPPPPPKRVFRTVTFAGSEYTLSELSTLTGISHKSLAKRIFERGWPVEKAIAKG